MFLAERFDIVFITVALFATQVEIAMHSLNLIAKQKQYTQQADAVCTTAKCHQIAFPFVKQMLLLDKLLYGLWKGQLCKLFYV